MQESYTFLSLLDRMGKLCSIKKTASVFLKKKSNGQAGVIYPHRENGIVYTFACF
jgi:hypothetical protein